MKKMKKNNLLESDSLKFNILVNTIANSAVAIAIVQTLRANKSETWDRAVFGVSVLAGIYVLVSFLYLGKKNINKFYASISILILSIGIYGIEKHGTETTRGVDVSKLLWLGYGPLVLLATLLIIPFIFSIYSWSGLSPKIKVFLNILAVAVAVLVIPAIWQGGNSIIDRDSSEYVINENLAVSAGYLPYVNFIPQYGTFYSWLLYPFKNSLSADGLVTLSLYMMNIGAILSIAIGIWLVFKAMNKRSLALAVLLVIPFTSAAQFPYRKVYSGTIYSLFSQLPIRLLPGMILGYVLIKILVKNSPRLDLFKLLLAFFSGCTLWLNQDFAILSGLLVVAFLILYSKKFIRYFLLVITFGAGLFSYPILIYLTGNKINYSYVGFFAKQYESGFMAEPIITPGPVLIILPWIVALVCASFYLLIKERFSNIAIEEENRRAIITTAFFSLWTLIGFSYYLNRSYASGQMQILFLPLAVASASFFGYLFSKNSELPWAPKLNFKFSTWKISGIKRSSSYFLLAIVMSLPLASIIAFPNPAIEIDRLTSSTPDHVWPKPTNKQAFSSYELKSGTDSPDSYYGTSSNYVKLKYRLTSLSLFNSPFDITLGEQMVKLQCKYLNDLAFHNVSLNNEGVAISQAFESKTLCNAFTGDLTNKPYSIYRK
jgi:hypothetical protein